MPYKKHILTFILGMALDSEDILTKPDYKKFQHVQMWFQITSECVCWNQGF